jgi:hypothetical protein
MQNSYLEEMGIEVWLPRDSPQPEASQSADNGSPSDDKNHGGAPDESAVSHTAEEPNFHLCFLNYHSFGICLSLNDDEDGISSGARRFCDDVALALNGGVRQPGINNLKWPMRGSEDNSHAASQRVVSQRLFSLPGLVLVFGGATTDWIPGIEPRSNDGTAGTDRGLELDGKTVLTMESIDELCSGAGGKRTLWQRLQAVRSLLPGPENRKNQA